MPITFKHHIKGKIAVGLGIIVSILLLIKLYTWVYEAFLKIFVDYTVQWLMPLLPVGRDLGGVALHLTATLVFSAILLTVSYFLGSSASTFVGKVFRKVFGKYVSKIPGYGMLSKVVKNFIDGGGAKQFNRFGIAYLIPPGDGALSGQCMPVIVTGESETHFSVMTPSAPTPMSGFMYYFPKDQVVELDVDATEFFSYVVGMGVGSLAMLEKAKRNQSSDTGDQK